MSPIFDDDSGVSGVSELDDDEFNGMLRDITQNVLEHVSEEGIESIEPVFHLACISTGGRRSWGHAVVPELPDVSEIAETMMMTLGRVTFEQQGYIMAAFMVGIASVRRVQFGMLDKDLEDAIVIVGRTRDNRKNAVIIPLAQDEDGDLVLDGEPSVVPFLGSDTPEITSHWLDALFAGELARNQQGPNMPLDPHVHMYDSSSADEVVTQLLALVAKPDITERMN